MSECEAAALRGDCELDRERSASLHADMWPLRLGQQQSPLFLPVDGNRACLLEPLRRQRGRLGAIKDVGCKEYQADLEADIGSGTPVGPGQRCNGRYAA